MSQHGFGPLGPYASTQRPAAAADNFQKQTWFRDASAPGARDGTVPNASWFNHIIANLVHLCRSAGITFSNEQGADHFVHDAVLALAKKAQVVEEPEEGHTIVWRKGEWVSVPFAMRSLSDVQVPEANTGDLLAYEEGKVVARNPSTLVTVPRSNFTAITNPTVTDDEESYYEYGSTWLNTATDEAFICLDPTAGAALWVQTTITTQDLGSMAIQQANNVAITGGAINGTPIGVDAASSGRFSSLTTLATDATGASAMNGKVWSVDANGLFVLRRSSALLSATFVQTLAAGTSTLNTPTIVADEFGGGMAAGVFTVPAGGGGNYSIHLYLAGGMTIPANTVGIMDALIRLNGVNIARQRLTHANTTGGSTSPTMSCVASIVLKLIPGDTIDFQGNLVGLTGTMNAGAQISILRT